MKTSKESISYCSKVVAGTAKKSYRSIMRTSGGVAVESESESEELELVGMEVEVAVLRLIGKLRMILTVRPFA